MCVIYLIDFYLDKHHHRAEPSKGFTFPKI